MPPIRPVIPPQPVDFATLASRSHTLFNPAPPEAVLAPDCWLLYPEGISRGVSEVTNHRLKAVALDNGL